MGKTRFATRAIHAGQRPDPTTGAIMTPVYLTSTFVQESPGKCIDGYDYARSKNPTRTALEENLASLEGGKYGFCFSSGCASVCAVVHLLSSGDHVVLSDDVYGGTYRIFARVFQQMGISFTQVDLSVPGNLEKAITPKTKLVWLETPSNPLLKVLDIAALSAICAQKKVTVGVDNTFASPYLQNPLALGADIVCHSLTKYLGGHSDLIGGALVVKDGELAERIRFIQNAEGGILSAFDSFMVLRSTKTLEIRMQRHCENAGKIARWLEKHPGVDKVIYPGLSSHPQHAVAKKQMRDFGGMVTVVLKGGLAPARKVLERVKVFSLAESLGGVESLIEHPAIMTHASIPQAQREAIGVSDGMIRLSVGLEDVQDLLEDLEQAMK